MVMVNTKYRTAVEKRSMVETEYRTVVELSGEHLRRGDRLSSTGCAIGLAVRDVYPAADRITVDWRGVTIVADNRYFVHDAVEGSALRELVMRMKWGEEIKPQRLVMEFRQVEGDVLATA